MGYQDNQQPGVAMIVMASIARLPAGHLARSTRPVAECLDVRAYRTSRPLAGGLAFQASWLPATYVSDQRQRVDYLA